MTKERIMTSIYDAYANDESLRCSWAIKLVFFFFFIHMQMWVRSCTFVIEIFLPLLLLVPLTSCETFFFISLFDMDSLLPSCIFPALHIVLVPSTNLTDQYDNAWMYAGTIKNFVIFPLHAILIAAFFLTLSVPTM